MLTRNVKKHFSDRDNEGAMKCVLTLAKWLSQDSTLGLMALSQGPCLHSLLGMFMKLRLFPFVKQEIDSVEIIIFTLP